MKLENWYIQIACSNKTGRLQDLLKVPCRLAGNIYGDSRLKDGCFVSTHIIMNIQNGVATTMSGISYALGTPFANFKDYVSIKDSTEAIQIPQKFLK